MGLINRIKNASDVLAVIEKHLCEVEHLPEHEAFYLDAGLDKAVARMDNLLKRVRHRGQPAVWRVSVTTPFQEVSAKEQASRLAAQNAKVSIVDTGDGIVDLLKTLESCLHMNMASPQLAIVAKGDMLGRTGTMTVLTLYVLATDRVFVVDIHLLGHAAFRTTVSTDNSTTLQHLLESANLKKLMWDCRSDAEALYHHFDIELRGVVDGQLLDLATLRKARDRRRLRALSVGLSHRIFKGDKETSRIWQNNYDWVDVMLRYGIEEAERMHRDSRGDFTAAGSSSIDDDPQFERIEDGFGGQTYRERSDYKSEHAFTVRPLHQWLVEYCVNEVRWLPAMYWHFIAYRFWNEAWEDRVNVETERRLVEARKEQRQPNETRASPKGWVQVEQVEKMGYS